MQQWVERNDCVDMKLFLAATDVKLVSELKKRYLSDFEVVMDPIGVIHTGFGVSPTPFYRHCALTWTCL